MSAQGKWAVILADRRGTVMSWSDAAAELMDLPAGSAVGHPLDALLASDEEPGILGSLEGMCDDVLRPAPVLLVRRRNAPGGVGDGVAPLRLTFVRATEERVALLLGEHGPAERSRVNRYGLLEDVGHQVSEGVVLANTQLDGVGPRVLYANDAARCLLGRIEGDVRGEPLFELLDPARRDGLRSRIRDVLRKGGDHLTEQVVVERPRGRHAMVEWSLRAVQAGDGQVTHYVSVQRDITDDVLRGGGSRGADVDPLTGLPNRERFLGRLARSVEWAKLGERYAFTVLGFEMMEFEAMERHWGVAVSNLLVEALAWRIRRCLRPNDQVARITHERLGVLLEHSDDDWDVRDLLNRIRREISLPYVIGGHRISQGVRGGALPILRRADLPGDAESVMGLLEQALSAPTPAEAPPGFTPIGTGQGGRGATSGVVGLELRRSLAKNELRIRYQPIVALESGTIQGMEALLLWQHPTRGLLPARSFLHHAEGTGLMEQVGRWAVAEACAHLRSWREQRSGAPQPPIHLNISPAEFWDRDPVGRLIAVLENAGLEPGDFRLEVSEGTLSRNPAAASLVIERLVEVGFEPWMEGFGGGRLGMRDILRMPFRYFKLDPALLWEESGSGGRVPSPFMLALARLAQELGRKVVAGNVETMDERRQLRPESCTLAQGTLYANPIAAGAVPSFLDSRSVIRR